MRSVISTDADKLITNIRTVNSFCLRIPAPFVTYQESQSRSILLSKHWFFNVFSGTSPTFRGSERGGHTKPSGANERKSCSYSRPLNLTHEPILRSWFLHVSSGMPSGLNRASEFLAIQEVQFRGISHQKHQRRGVAHTRIID